MDNVFIIFLIAQFCFLVGFLLGRNMGNKISFPELTKHDKQTKIIEKIKSVKIDEARFVTKVSDDKFVKAEKELGKNSVVEDDISSSISKLAQLKQRK